MKAIIALNAGSSSIKFGLFRIIDGAPVHAGGGKLENIGDTPHLIATNEKGDVLVEKSWEGGAALTHEDLLAELFGWAQAHLDPHAIIGIGHRIVHGGSKFFDPVLVTDSVLNELEALCPLAPLHQPHNLAGLRASRAFAGAIPQIACFDTGFHHDMGSLATAFALPRDLRQKGIRRYGFHGLSYAYIARRLRKIDPALARGRVIVAHLGSGASLCAMLDGHSVDTTMGFTALDGLMMGTRCGTLDPGVVLHLIMHETMSAQAVEHMLYHESGLLGVSGVSGDMRQLHASTEPAAGEAINLFVWRIAREIGALTSSLGGLDGIVFTAGIGENDSCVRSAITKRLGWLGVKLDDEANRANDALLSTGDSAVVVRMIPTDEERMIALATNALLHAG